MAMEMIEAAVIKGEIVSLVTFYFVVGGGDRQKKSHPFPLIELTGGIALATGATSSEVLRNLSVAGVLLLSYNGRDEPFRQVTFVVSRDTYYDRRPVAFWRTCLRRK